MLQGEKWTLVWFETVVYDNYGVQVIICQQVNELYEIKNADVIVLGDFGVGFSKRGWLDLEYEKIKSKLESANITIHTIRGNHDDPSYFVDPINYERIRFLEDHRVYEIAGFLLYTIGGANSHDIEWRLKYNDKMKKFGSSKRVWWEGEDVIRKPLEEIGLDFPIDLIVSHEAPLVMSPVPVKRDISLEQYNKILDTREYLNQVLFYMKPKNWFYGHYHNSYSGDIRIDENNSTLYRCMDIMELYEVHK